MLSQTLRMVQELVGVEDYEISQHANVKLATVDVSLDETLDGVHNAQVAEDHPEFYKGPSVPVLQTDERGSPLHVLLGIPIEKISPAVLVTIYRPDELRWADNFLVRR